MKIRFVCIFSLVLLSILSGCQETSATERVVFPQNENSNQEDLGSSTAYPVLDSEPQIDTAYPAIGDVPSGRVEGPRFEIFKPVNAGDTIIEGTGPADVPIKLIDVTEVGTLLGETTISNEGLFRFELNKPIQSGHTIGIQLGDISNTDLNPQDFQYSSTYYDRPQVGILFDIVNIK